MNMKYFFKRKFWGQTPHFAGQASVVLILLAAIALIFFAVTLNWGRVSQIKNVTTTATTNAAAATVSGIASYGQSIIKSQLDGTLSKCTFSSWFKYLIVAGILIAIVLCSGVCAPALSPAISAALATAITIAGVTAVLQIAVIQPGMSRAWNKQQATLPVSDQFLEQGLATGAQDSVADQTKIVDYFDMNVNGKFGPASGDTISRYGFFYTERLKALKKPLQSLNITVFLDGLRKLRNKLSEGCPNGKASYGNDPHCNPCCLPLTTTGGPLIKGGVRVRPANCPNDLVPPQCPADYPFIYDPSYPDYNSGGSFLARFGVDTEKKPFETTKAQAKGIFSMFWDMSGMSSSRFDPAKVATNPQFGLKPDKVKAPDNTQAVIYNDDGSVTPMCAEQKDTSQGFWWRKGSDQFCSTTWPYNQCARTACKKDSCNQCTPATAADWPEDPADDIVYSLKDFYLWSRQLLKQDDATLRGRLNEWYPEVAFWVGPECKADGSNAVVCQKGGGALYKIDDRLTSWRLILTAWLNSDEDDVTTDDLLNDYCTRTGRCISPYFFAREQAWCVPPAPGTYYLTNPEEIDYIQNHDTCPGCYTNSDGSTRAFTGNKWGSLNSVIACLDWNSTNDVRFKNCLDALDAITCSGSPLPSECQNLPGAPAYDACAIAPFADWLTQAIAAATDSKGKDKLTQCQTAISGAQCTPSSTTIPPSCGDDKLPRSLNDPVKNPKPAFGVTCPNPSASPFRQWVADSYANAPTQVNSVKDRFKFLTKLKQKAKAALKAAADGKLWLDDFLNGPAEPGHPNPDTDAVPNLLRARLGFEGYIKKLPNFLIYGWQSHDPKNPTAPGRWHMVRSEGLIPGKCPSKTGEDTCGTVAQNEHKFPWIYTYTHAWGTRKCYDLKDYTGKILVRLTRWDEERQAQVGFNNKVSLWDFRFSKPGLDTTAAPPASDLTVFCQGRGFGPAGDYILNNPNGTLEDKKSIQEAFMLNTSRSDPLNVIPGRCWDTVEALLSTGTKTTACAAYDAQIIDSDEHAQMTAKFVPCPAGAFYDDKTVGNY